MQNSVILLKSAEADFSLFMKPWHCFTWKLFQSSFLLGFHALRMVQFVLFASLLKPQYPQNPEFPLIEKAKAKCY